LQSAVGAVLFNRKRLAGRLFAAARGGRGSEAPSAVAASAPGQTVSLDALHALERKSDAACTRRFLSDNAEGRGTVARATVTHKPPNSGLRKAVVRACGRRREEARRSGML